MGSQLPCALPGNRELWPTKLSDPLQSKGPGRVSARVAPTHNFLFRKHEISDCGYKNLCLGQIIVEYIFWQGDVLHYSVSSTVAASSPSIYLNQASPSLYGISTFYSCSFVCVTGLLGCWFQAYKVHATNLTHSESTMQILSMIIILPCHTPSATNISDYTHVFFCLRKAKSLSGEFFICRGTGKIRPLILCTCSNFLQ